MKDSNIKLGIISMILILLLTFGLAFTINACGKSQEIEQKPQNLVINTTKPTDRGTLTIVYPDGSVYYSYEGEIDILNSGRNGEPIDIRIELPTEE